jgi:hypothetical protein
MWRGVDIVNRRFGGTYRLHLQGRRKILEWGNRVSRCGLSINFFHTLFVKLASGSHYEVWLALNFKPLVPLGMFHCQQAKQRFWIFVHVIFLTDEAANSPQIEPRHGAWAIHSNVPAVRSDSRSADSSLCTLCHSSPCPLQREAAEPYSPRHRGQQGLPGGPTDLPSSCRRSWRSP